MKRYGLATLAILAAGLAGCVNINSPNAQVSWAPRANANLSTLNNRSNQAANATEGTNAVDAATSTAMEGGGSLDAQATVPAASWAEGMPNN